MQASKLAAARAEQGRECLTLQGGKPPAGQQVNPFVGASPHTPAHKPQLEPAMPHKGANQHPGASGDSGLKDGSAGRGVVVAVIPQSSIHTTTAVAIKKKSHGKAWARVEIA